MLFGAGTHTTVRWIGNEHGFAAEETWSKSKVDDKNINSNEKNGYTQGFPDGNQWTVPEADARITSGWFWGNNKKTPKSMEALSEMYFRSVGHNAPLLLNIPPNDQGKVDDAILNRVKEFGTNIKTSFANNLAKDAVISASSVRGNDIAYSPKNLVDGQDKTYWTVADGQKTGSITVKLPKRTSFDVVSLEESIEFGQRIGNYKVEYRKNGEQWKTFEEGKTVGAKRLCRKHTVVADEVKITVTAYEKADVKVPMLSEIGLYKVTSDMSMRSGIPEGLKIKDDRKFTQSGWNQETGDQFLECTGMWTSALNKEATVTFNGTRVWLVGTVDPKHGTADIYIDGKKVKSINTNASQRKLGQVLFESDDLTNTEHTLKIVNTGTGQKNAIGIDGIAYLDNGGKGAVQIEYPTYRVNENSEVPITVKRIGGTKGEVKVQFQVNPGSAWQDHFNADGNMELTFADGQKEAKAKVTTKRVPAKTGDLSFSIELVNPTNGAIVGFNNPSTVVITDTEEFNKDALKAKIDEVINANYDASQYTHKSYQSLQEALAYAQKVYNMPNINNQKCAEAASALDNAVHGLVKRATFTQEDPFVLPSRVNDKKVLEAEYAILDSSHAKDPNQKYVRVVEDSSASNGAKVGWFEEGNEIKVPFNAAKTGKYTFKVTYQSGRLSTNPNQIWLASENMSKPVIKDVYCTEGDTDGNTYQTIEFDVEIPKAGNGIFTFKAKEKGSPNIDKIEITAKEVAMDSYKIDAIAGEHGKISPVNQTTVTEGQNQKYIFTPDKDYTVKEVYIDGQPIGARLDYTFEDVSANHTIKVEFVKSAIDAENRFVFPVRGQTAVLEAERMELYNVGPENEEYKLGVSESNWASMGKIVNAMNSGDTMKLYYNAPQPGEYDVTLTYRSGSEQNSLSWSEANQKIANGNETIGSNDSTKTRTKQFKIVVKQAGLGVITFATGEKGAPQMDKFVITNNQDSLKFDALGKAVADCQALNLADYKDGKAKDVFKQALQEAQSILESAQKGETTQEAIDLATTKLEKARKDLVLNDQKPAVNKTELEELVKKALEYKEDLYTAESYNNLKNAITKANDVLSNKDATLEEVTDAKVVLQNAINGLEAISPITPEVPKPGDSENGTVIKPDTSNNSEITNKPETGDVTSILPFAGVVGSVIAMLGMRKKKSDE